MAVQEVVAGKCHCGAVEWQANLPAAVVLNCHCGVCRSLNGADYSSWVIFKDADFEILRGEAMVKSYRATANIEKHFCDICAAVVKFVNNDKFPGHTYVARGNITTPVDLPVNLQVFTKDKATWSKLDPDLPEYNP